jgi:hypothetical protein
VGLSHCVDDSAIGLGSRETENIMKKLIAIAALTTFVVMSSACSSGSIVGKWERMDTKSIMEFTADGKIVHYSAAGERSESGWTFKSDSTGKLEINDTNINPKCIYKIEGSKMTMSCSVAKGGDYPKDFKDGAQMTFERK